MAADGELPLLKRSGKSEAAFRTISEVAEDLDVPQHVLRFWESKFPQVKPLKRGGGRRYYRPEDVGLLRRIRDLLYSEGYTIKGVQKLLKEGAVTKDAAAAPTAGSANGATPADEAAPSLRPEAEEGDGDGDEAADAAETTDMHAADAVSCEMPGADPDYGELGLAGAPHPGGSFSPQLRSELADILEELEQLRGLLQPRER